MSSNDKVRQVPFALLAEAKREVLQEAAAVQWLLEHLAEMLPPDSPTAKAIARHAPWREILQLARWAGDAEVASVLEEALENLGPDMPPQA